MFHNLLHVIDGQPPPDDPRRFVEEVRLVERMPARNVRVERLILVCWLAIAAKCALVAWLVDRYDMPFSPLWVNAPTVFFALMCTAVYVWRE